MSESHAATMPTPAGHEAAPTNSARSTGFLKILILEDMADDKELSLRQLKREGIPYEARWARNRDEFTRLLQESQSDLILADYGVPGFSGFDALDLALDVSPGIPFIYLSGSMDDGLAVDSLHRGATDYVLKNNLRRLAPAVQRAMAERQERDARRWTAARLQESEAVYESLVENVPLSILREDHEGRITFANPEFCDFVGQPTHEVIGSRLENFAAPDTALDIIQRRRDNAAGALRGRRIEEFVTAEGARRRIEIVRACLRDNSGIPSGQQVMFWDVTEQQAQRDSLAEQANLLDLAPVAIIVVDGEGRVSYWNRGAETIHGLRRDDAIGRRLSELVPFGPREFEQALDGVCDTGDHKFEFTIDAGSRHPRHLHSHWKLATSGEQAEGRIIVMNSDLTDFRKLEQQFFRAQRMDSIGTLSCGVAHDLNNILGPIMMAADLILCTNEDPLTAENCRTISESAKRGASIIRQLLTFGRGIEGQKIGLEIRLVIQELARMARETFPKSIHVRNQVKAGLWTVVGDATQIHQVFLNLLVNARDAMPEGGEITLTAENFEVNEEFARYHDKANPGPHLMLTVSDTGEGMTPEVRERIFDPFYTTKPDGKGTGLGLATTLGIVQGHGGFLTVYSQPGKGTTFNVFLPADPSQQAVDEESHTVFLTRGQGQTVLVVDDEERYSGLLAMFLTNQGYEPIVAANGVEALQRFQERESEISLVISDVDMPGLNGLGLARAIRGRRPDMPMIIISGLGAEDQVTPFESELGIQDFLLKPFGSKTLLAAVDQARQRAQQRDAGDF